MTRQETCARCGVDAVMWSGAFGEPWVGWCSNFCKNAWLDGDKDSGASGVLGAADSRDRGKAPASASERGDEA